jgi:methionyl-tRNA synthetase
MIAAVRGHLDRQAFHLALDVIWLVVGDGNRYIDNQAPWGLKKTDPVRMNTVLFVLAETIRHLGLVLQAFMPQSAGRILDQLGVGTTDRQLDRVGSVGRLQPGTPISEPQPIFPRFVEEGVQNAVAG